MKDEEREGLSSNNPNNPDEKFFGDAYADEPSPIEPNNPPRGKASFEKEDEEPTYFDFGGIEFDDEEEVQPKKDKGAVSSTGFNVRTGNNEHSDTYGVPTEQEDVLVEPVARGTFRNSDINEQEERPTEIPNTVKETQDTPDNKKSKKGLFKRNKTMDNQEDEVYQTEDIDFLGNTNIQFKDEDVDDILGDANLDDGTNTSDPEKKSKVGKKGKKPFIIAGVGIAGVVLIGGIAINALYLGDRPSSKEKEPTNQTQEEPTNTTEGQIVDSSGKPIEESPEDNETEEEKDKAFANGTTEVLEGEENVVDDKADEVKRSYVDYYNSYLGFTTKYLSTWVKEETTQEYLNTVTKATKKGHAFNIQKNKLGKGVRTVDIKAVDFKDTQRIITVWVYPTNSKTVKGGKFIYDKELYKPKKKVVGAKVGKRINSIKTAELKTVFHSYGHKYEGYQSTIKIGQNTVIVTASGLYGNDKNKDMKATFANIVKNMTFTVVEEEKIKKQKAKEAKEKAKAEKSKDSSDAKVKEDDLTNPIDKEKQEKVEKAKEANSESKDTGSKDKESKEEEEANK